MSNLKKNISANKNIRLAAVPIMSVNPSPYQARKRFNQHSIDELADSIAKNGLLQPIVVRQSAINKYELVAGERRLRACKLNNYKQINAIIINADDEQSAIFCMVENVHRQQLHFFEEAQGYAKLIQTHNMTQTALASRLGLQQSTIANKLRLLKLDDIIMAKILRYNLSERHARGLLRIINPKDRLKILEKIIIRKLNVRESEALINAYLIKENVNTQRGSIRRLYSDWRLLNNSVKSLVEKMQLSGSSINYKVTDLGESVQMTIVINKTQRTQKQK